MNWPVMIGRIVLNLALVALAIYGFKVNPTLVAFTYVAIVGFFAHRDGWRAASDG